MPFRGLLLGLFFITTGASVDPHLLLREWHTTTGLLVGLISIKALIAGGLGRAFGLSNGDAVRAGLLLSGGGATPTPIPKPETRSPNPLTRHPKP